MPRSGLPRKVQRNGLARTSSSWMNVVATKNKELAFDLIYYSQRISEQLKLEDVLNAYKPR